MSGVLGFDNRYIAILLIIFLRYLVLASVAFLIFYYSKRKAWSFRKIQSNFPTLTDYQREFLYSVSTSIIFASLGYLFFFGPIAPYTLVYKDISAHSWTYFFVSVILTQYSLALTNATSQPFGSSTGLLD